MATTMQGLAMPDGAEQHYETAKEAAKAVRGSTSQAAEISMKNIAWVSWMENV